jgi:hypothetical protein
VHDLADAVNDPNLAATVPPHDVACSCDRLFTGLGDDVGPAVALSEDFPAATALANEAHCCHGIPSLLGAKLVLPHYAIGRIFCYQDG